MSESTELNNQKNRYKKDGGIYPLWGISAMEANLALMKQNNQADSPLTRNNK